MQAVTRSHPSLSVTTTRLTPEQSSQAGAHQVCTATRDQGVRQAPGGKLTRTSPAATTTTTITLLPTPATGGNSFSYILVVEGGGRGDLEIFLLKI